MNWSSSDRSTSGRGPLPARLSGPEGSHTPVACGPKQSRAHGGQRLRVQPTRVAPAAVQQPHGCTQCGRPGGPSQRTLSEQQHPGVLACPTLLRTLPHAGWPCHLVPCALAMPAHLLQQRGHCRLQVAPVLLHCRQRGGGCKAQCSEGLHLPPQLVLHSQLQAAVQQVGTRHRLLGRGRRKVGRQRHVRRIGGGARRHHVSGLRHRCRPRAEARRRHGAGRWQGVPAGRGGVRCRRGLDSLLGGVATVQRGRIRFCCHCRCCRLLLCPPQVLAL